MNAMNECILMKVEYKEKLAVKSVEAFLLFFLYKH